MAAGSAAPVTTAGWRPAADAERPKFALTPWWPPSADALDTTSGTEAVNAIWGQSLLTEASAAEDGEVNSV